MIGHDPADSGHLRDAPDVPSVSCCVCCREIPHTAALTPEGAGYVGHFCGTACFQRFTAEAALQPVQTPQSGDCCAESQADGLSGLSGL